MSESNTSKDIFAPWLQGIGLNIGFGGSKVAGDNEITFDMPEPYTNVGDGVQIIRGDARRLPMFCSESLNWIHSAHLCEDFPYSQLVEIIKEWRRVLKVGSHLLTNCPNQQKFLAHCKKSGQLGNAAHFEQDFSLQTWNQHVIAHTGPWEVVYENDNHGPYSWLQCLKKISL
jgi:predicted SAM-dependent methyltransferase